MLWVIICWFSEWAASVQLIHNIIQEKISNSISNESDLLETKTALRYRLKMNPVWILLNMFKREEKRKVLFMIDKPSCNFHFNTFFNDLLLPNCTNWDFKLSQVWSNGYIQLLQIVILRKNCSAVKCTFCPPQTYSMSTLARLFSFL